MSSPIRTDLALEARELWQQSAGQTTKLEGVRAREGERFGLPVTVVEVLDETNETWWYVLYLKTTGYMMREFLREQDG